MIRWATSASRDSASSSSPGESSTSCSSETARARAGSVSVGDRSAAPVSRSGSQRSSTYSTRLSKPPGLAARPSWQTYGGSTVTRPATACCRVRSSV